MGWGSHGAGQNQIQPTQRESLEQMLPIRVFTVGGNDGAFIFRVCQEGHSLGCCPSAAKHGTEG